MLRKTCIASDAALRVKTESKDTADSHVVAEPGLSCTEFQKSDQTMREKRLGLVSEQKGRAGLGMNLGNGH